MPLKLLQVAWMFGSNKVVAANLEISFFKKINNLRTLILSNADSLTCSVLLPQIIGPVSLNVAIGFNLPTYNVSLSSKVSFFLALVAFTTPLVYPADANQGKATLSVKAIFLITSDVGGINICLLFALSLTCIQG